MWRDDTFSRKNKATKRAGESEFGQNLKKVKKGW